MLQLEESRTRLVGRSVSFLNDVARLLLMEAIEPWQNSTPYFVQKPSVQTKLTILGPL